METFYPRAGRRPATLPVVEVRGEVIRAARLARELSGLKFCKRLRDDGCSISGPTLYAIERNKTKPEVRVALAICYALGLNFAAVAVGQPTPTPAAPEAVVPDEIAGKLREIEKMIEGLVLDQQRAQDLE